MKESIKEKILLAKEQIEENIEGTVDVEKSAEMSLDASQEWRNFIAKLTIEFEEEFNKIKSNIIELIEK
jgi:hypothetical protein